MYAVIIKVVLLVLGNGLGFCIASDDITTLSETSKPVKDKQQYEELYLVPFDNISTEVLTNIGNALKEQLPLEYRLVPKESVPPYAYNPRRGQYFSTALLALLSRKYAAPGRRVLGVVEVDLFVPELNFVFGEADPVSKTAIISLTRLHQEFYGLERDEALFMRRALTEAVHELGHTYDLQHCSDQHCVMFFSNSLADTDRKGYRFCSRCQRRLQKILQKYSCPEE